jgi:hypothetical protein
MLDQKRKEEEKILLSKKRDVKADSKNQNKSA